MVSFTSLAISALALASTGLSTPIAKRADASTFIPSISALTSSVKTYTANMNATSASYSTLSTADQAVALTSIATDASSITDLITSYTAQIPAIENGATFASKRQDADAATTELATDLAMLLGEINSSLNLAQTATGEQFAVTKRQIAVIPLGSALSNLLLALDVVVDDLLQLVKEIVDGLLIGLAGALAGVVI